MIPASFCALSELLAGRSVAVLTGAGCSTESGIPDYRGSPTGSRTPTPIMYRDFLEDAHARRRYWARSAVGWPRMARARPNPAHRALARLESAAVVRGVITQNVDGLHRAAGSRRVVELHGSLEEVRCLGCGGREERADVQRRLLALNPGWWDAGEARAAPAPDGDARLAPDGDARVSEAGLGSFRVPGCLRCGGILKPDVVFFGENVPPERVESAWRLFSAGDALLVAGSSLAVYSGYRFVERAGEEGIPVGIVNLGETRADGLARVRVRGRVGEVLPELADALLAQPTSGAGDAVSPRGPLPEARPTG